MGQTGDTHEYLTFAERDYNHIAWAYNSGCRDGMLAPIGQNACEKYLKDLITKWYEPTTAAEQEREQHILRTHSLRVLTDFIKNTMEINIPQDVEDLLRPMGSYYFACRYPGDDSFLSTGEDDELAYKAVSATREFILTVEHELEVYQKEAEENMEQQEKNQMDYDAWER